ncbi:MAG: methyltransferase [Desulfobulbaceae bacterium]|nr:methyltransferase [Desulfobulbaceae bacterium]
MELGLNTRPKAETPISALACPEGCSADTLFGGRLVCHQPRNGYRFSVDAVLLAHFVRPRRGWRILDLGCGCGVVALIIAYRFLNCTLSAVECQHDLALIAGHNVQANGFQARIQVVEADLRHLQGVLSPESFDLVVCNPPYFAQNKGRLSKNVQAAQARHDLTATLTDFIRAAAYAVKNRGRVAFIYPASSQAILQQQLLDHRLSPKRMQVVYSYPAADRAALVLVEAMKNGGDDCRIMPPFYLYSQAGGTCSDPVQELYQENQEGPCWPRY